MSKKISKVDIKLKSALACFQANQLTDAESILSNIIKKDKRHPEANHLMGIIAFRAEQYEAAEHHLKITTQVRSANTDAWNSLGNVYNKQGHYDKAIICYQKALSIDPSHINAHNNIATAYASNKDFDRAIIHYEMAIYNNPEFLSAINNLGTTYVKTGDDYSAMACYECAIKKNPALPDAYYELGYIYKRSGDLTKALSYFSNTSSFPFSPNFMEMAIYSYIDGNIDDADKYADKIRQHFGSLQDNLHIKVASAYLELISKLIAFRRQNPAYYEQCHNQEVIYCIGESHCLPPANLCINYQQQQHLLQSKIVVGGKAWNLRKENNNRFKVEFENILSTIPVRSTVVLIFGEIDCHYDEGILKNYKKTSNDLDASIVSVVTGYIEYVSEKAHQHELNIIIYGIPAPYGENIDATNSDNAVLIKTIRIFNDTLKSECARNNIKFLDVYAETDSGDGISDGIFHIDKHHLSPAIFPIIFSKLEERED